MSENFEKLYAESMEQLANASEQSWQSLLSLCVAAGRIAAFDGDVEPLKQVWRLPESCHIWQDKARRLLAYLLADGQPVTSKAGKVSYLVRRDAVKITAKGQVSLPEKAKEAYQALVRKHDLKGSRTAAKAMALINSLRWQAPEKAQALLNCQQVADLLEGLQVDETCKPKIVEAVALLRK